MNFEKPILTVDIVLLTLIEGRLKVALHQRETDPFAGRWALVGGYVRTNEDADCRSAALRILREKLDFEPRHLEQVVTRANAVRDPRGWSASIVHLALNEPTALEALVARGAVKLFDAEDNGAHLPADMAFDHAVLIEQVVARLRSKAAYSTIVGHLLPEVFTITELQSGYEAVMRKKLNPANFRRKILELAELEPVATLHNVGRPAQGYRLARDLDYFDRQLG